MTENKLSEKLEKNKNGGRRPGSGRKKGVPNKRTEAMAKAIAASGLTPLEYMLQVMRDEKQNLAMRMDAAKGAAPYVHAKLATVEHNGNVSLTHSYADIMKAALERTNKAK